MNFVFILAVSIIYGKARSIEPPIATPASGTSFESSLDVVLLDTNEKSSPLQILWDFDHTNDQVLPTNEYGDPPIKLTESKTIRAVVCNKGAADFSKCSEIESFAYTKVEPTNNPPTLSLGSPTANQVLRQNVPITLSLKTVSDPDADAGDYVAKVIYFISTSQNGTWSKIGESTTASFSLDWTPTSGTGTHYIHATAEDSHGAIGKSENILVTLTPPNQTPTISIASSPTGSIFTSPATLNLSALANDPDMAGGKITKVEYYLNGTLLTPSSPLTPPNYAYTLGPVDAGTYEITAKAYDNNSPPAIGNSNSLEFKVVENKAPDVSVTNPNNGSFHYAPATLTLSALATDSDMDDNIDKVTFHANGVLLGEGSTSGGGSYQLTKDFTTEGSQVITAKAYDKFGAFTTSSPITIKVAYNKAPTVNAGSNTTLTLPEKTLNLNGSADDPEKSTLTYLWSGPPGVSFSNPNLLNPTVTFPESAGPYTLSLKATDSGTPSLSATGEITVTLKAMPVNLPPTVDAGTYADLFLPTKSLVLNATGDDPEKSTLTYLWSGPPEVIFSNPTLLNPTATFPESAGSYTLSLKVTDSGTPTLSATDNATVNIAHAPVSPLITSSGSAKGEATKYFSYRITASGFPTPNLTTGPLPSWLFYQNSGGVVTLAGTPNSIGFFNVILNAENIHGKDTKNLTINIVPQKVAPTITSGTSASGEALKPFSYTLTAIGNPTPTLSATGSPSWLSATVAGETLLLSGTPPTAGSHSITLNASNEMGTDSKFLSINIGPAKVIPTITNPLAASGEALKFFSLPLSATGYPAPTFTISGNPGWLTLSIVGGIPTLSGTPSTAGPYTVTVTATNSVGSDSKLVTLTIKEAQTKPTITSPLLASGAALQKFSYTLTASGNPTPTMGASDLPSWLTLAAGGVLSGTPPMLGTFPITLTATNSIGVDTKTLSIVIGDSLTKPVLPSTLTAWGKAGIWFSYPILAKGTSPINFTTGTLPAGLTLQGSTISGLPSTTGIYFLLIRASNGYGFDEKVLTLNLTQDPRLTLDLPDSLVVMDKSKATLTVAGTGFPALTYQWAYAGADNVFLNIGTNSPTYTLNQVSPSSAGKYRVTLKNSSGPAINSKTCRLIIKPLPKPIAFIPGGQPVPIKVSVGKTATFNVKATGEPPLFYRWYKGAVALKPAAVINDSVLSITNTGFNDSGIYKVVVTNAYSKDLEPSTYAVSDTARLTVLLPQLFPPKANPGTTASFSDPLSVILFNDTAQTITYYTTNGMDPTEASTPYSTPIAIKTTTKIKAISYKNGFFRASNIATFDYTFTPKNTVAKPTIGPNTLTFKNAMLCTLSTIPADAEIRYTTDGSNPLGPTGNIFKTSFPITSTTTVIALAQKAGLTPSDTAMRTFVLEKTVSKVQTPTANPSSRNFNLQQKILISSQTDSATILYTTDGTKPDTSSTRLVFPDTGLTLFKTTTIQAVAIRKGWNNSDIDSWTYNLVPTLKASPNSGVIFEVDTLVKLTVSPALALIRFTTDGTAPMDTSPIFPAEGIKISETTTLSAIAMLDGISSSVFTFSYSKKGGQLAAPSILTSGNVSSFKDSLKINITATPGSTLYYTTNGDLPTNESATFDTPFWIDSTTTIQAMAVKPGFLPSRILFSTFVLIPEKPLILPSGGSYVGPQKVTLRNISKRAKLFYTLDGNEPDPFNRMPYAAGDTIPITSSTVLKAVAVAGNLASEVETATYNIFGVKDTVIQPGDIYFLEGGYSVVNPEGQSAQVRILLTRADSLKIKGFDGVQYALNLSLAENQIYSPMNFPSLNLTRQRLDKRALYKIEPDGRVYFISGSDTMTVNQPGLYFMGIDISPPVITYLKETIDAKDSTQVDFRIEDNVAILACDIKRNDTLITKVIQNSIKTPMNFNIKMKHREGMLKPLELQLTVSDYNLTTSYPPKPGTFLSLSQSLGKLIGPEAWSIGKNPKALYDFIGIPLALNPPLTLASLEATQKGLALQGAKWSAKDSAYLPLARDEILKSGQGYWLASRTAFSALNLTQAKTQPQERGKFTINLKRGWNQIANPHLEKLYWPISWAFPEALRASTTKALWGYDASLADFKESNVLEPWRGYYVYCYSERDSVTLSSQPILAGALKKQSQASETMTLSMGWGKARTLYLGADANGHNELGIEDEMEIPRQKSMTYLKAMRGGKALSTDWINLQSRTILEWKVAMGGSGDSLAPLNILDQHLPPQYETWAVSKSRSMKFKLESGKSIPASGLAQDTLLIYSGPGDLLAKLGNLKDLATHAPNLNLSVFQHKGGFSMEVGLPSRAKISAILWGLNGQRLGAFSMGPIAEGLYHFNYSSEFKPYRGNLKPGIYVLTLDLEGKDIHTRLVKKVFLSQ